MTTPSPTTPTAMPAGRGQTRGDDGSASWFAPRGRVVGGAAAVAVAASAFVFALAGCDDGGTTSEVELAAGTSTSAPNPAPATELRLIDTNPNNIDVDLGPAGDGAGDMQIFTDDLFLDGQPYGTSTGQCVVALATDSRLVVHCLATYLLPDGTLTLQFVNDEDPASGPTEITAAVTGGTGAYSGAAGTSVMTFRTGTDTLDVVVRLS